MSRTMLAAVMLLLLAGCSSSTSTPPASGGGTPPSPVTATGSPGVAASAAGSAEPSATAAAYRRLAGIGRQMDAGSYFYDQAFPHVSLDLPAGWFLDEAMPRHFGVRPKDMPVEDTFIVWFDMHLASKDRSCPEEPVTGIGHAAKDLEDGFRANPGVVTTSSRPAEVGGLKGHTFDVSLAPTWKRPCPFTNGVPTVTLFVDDDIDGEPAFWGVSGPERIRMIVLDDEHGSNVLVTFDSMHGDTLDAIEAAAKPILATFHFNIES